MSKRAFTYVELQQMAMSLSFCDQLLPKFIHIFKEMYELYDVHVTFTEQFTKKYTFCEKWTGNSFMYEPKNEQHI